MAYMACIEGRGGAKPTLKLAVLLAEHLGKDDRTESSIPRVGRWMMGIAYISDSPNCHHRKIMHDKRTMVLIGFMSWEPKLPASKSGDHSLG